MVTRVKICCIQSAQEARMALNAGADAFGLVAAMPSGPGPIPDKLIAEIADDVAGMSVLLTAETRAEAIADHALTLGTEAVQVVDHVPPDTLKRLRLLAPDLVIIAVTHVLDNDAVDVAKTAANHADYILLDSGSLDVAVKELGGTGRTHNWDISARIVATCGKPVWLAGGLNPENVADAIADVRPFGVDICSGLRPDGTLDKTLLAAFMKAVADA
jgi:phosphoribosylanthranilate isomerase